MVKVSKQHAIQQNQQIQKGAIVKTAQSLNSVWGTSINGEIEDTRQSSVTGDCWLLNYINSMRDTKWGKKMIKDAIKKDGAGGAIITLKGAKGAEKEFRVSAEEIIKARETGRYSSGDDDMIALELVMEKYLKKYGELHNRKTDFSNEPGAVLNAHGIGLDAFIELLSGKTATCNSSLSPRNNLLEEIQRAFDEKLRMLEEVEKHPDEYCVEVSFIGRSIDGSLVDRHAYQIKKVITENGKKYAIISDPSDSSKTQKKELNKLIPMIKLLDITENPDAKPNPNLRSDFDAQFDYERAVNTMLDELYNNIKDPDIEKLKPAIDGSTPDNIKTLFKDKNAIKAIIGGLDIAKYGWGKGKEKKELIAPLVDAYCEYAIKNNVDSKIVDDIKTACYKELDALLYTDEEVIIEKLSLLFDKINESDPLNKYKKVFGL